MGTEIKSQPRALFRFNEHISFMIVSVLMLKSESLDTVSKIRLLRKELSFMSTLFTEKIVNRFVLNKKSVTNSLFTRRSGINGTFERLKNVSKFDQ